MVFFPQNKNVFYIISLLNVCSLFETMSGADSLECHWGKQTTNSCSEGVCPYEVNYNNSERQQEGVERTRVRSRTCLFLTPDSATSWVTHEALAKMAVVVYYDIIKITHFPPLLILEILFHDY